MTLKEYSLAIDALMREHPEYEGLPVTYAADDEGNAYHKVHSIPSPIEYEDIDDYHLEPAYDEEGEMPGENYNAIIIN